MGKQVIRKVESGDFKYLVIMDESIAKLGIGSYLNHGERCYYTALCDHINWDKKISPEKCGFSEDVPIYSSDIFSLPTIDECIKLGIVLRRKNKRFNLKKNEIITLIKYCFNGKTSY